ncbi:hypothetical protein [Chitinophaga barathri]|uniref:Uncharacterized protein n=1 Tax=Chitinophaga barathri TaxID=1647451 RepID=A0A3N4M9V7_9BACT|nr:hypothetical protein [Chitinophaga barathri]RPD40524.1 hypothetical protein EG028_14560 [Chitinophaga barathri]
MKDFVDHIQQYASLLKKCSIWENSTEILAPVVGSQSSNVANDYIYEFYCYICIIIDLSANYDISFIEGNGSFKFAFPKKAAIKSGKPRFHASVDGKLCFQICAGTLIRSPYPIEKNHPDISFQTANASEDPDQNDLIMIMDAKFSEHPTSKLPKDEVYTFQSMVELFELRGQRKHHVEFDKLKDLEGNCLLTNARAHSDTTNIALLRKWSIKEVENFYPGRKCNVIG